jgi:hypothetical protein
LYNFPNPLTVCSMEAIPLRGKYPWLAAAFNFAITISCCHEA